MKTKETQASVTEFIDNVKNERRKNDSKVVMKMMREVTGKRAKMWGPSIVGYDKVKYTLANGKEGEICAIGFSPRSNALAFYGVTGFKNKESLFKKLGKYKMGQGSCLYINKLDDVDLDVLKQIFAKAYQEGQNDC